MNYNSVSVTNNRRNRYIIIIIVIIIYTNRYCVDVDVRFNRRFPNSLISRIHE